MPEIGESEFNKSWLDDIRTWPSPRPEDEGNSLLTATLEDLNKTHGTVGAEIANDMAIRM